MNDNTIIINKLMAVLTFLRIKGVDYLI